MEGALALMIPIISVGGFFAWMIALSPVGKAFAERLRAAKAPAGDREGQEELLESVEHLRREVAELAERVDFTERLLGQQRGGERLGRGA
jgi:aldehyde:ferredoxin oxidoreductase